MTGAYALQKIVKWEAVRNTKTVMPTSVRTAPIWRCDHAVELFFAGMGKEHWSLSEDYLSLRLPTPRLWLMANRPSFVNSLGVRGEWTRERADAWCIYCSSDTPEIQFLLDTLATHYADEITEFRDVAPHALMMRGYILSDGAVLAAMTQLVALQQNWRPSSQDKAVLSVPHMPPGLAKALIDDFHAEYAALRDASLFGLSLLHADTTFARGIGRLNLLIAQPTLEHE